MSTTIERRSVTIKGDEFKFSCAHFVAYKNYRERLHGHNYTVEVEARGTMSSDDGYVIDFGILKKSIRSICKSLSEKIIVPMNSPVLTISTRSNPLWTPGAAREASSAGECLQSCGVNDVEGEGERIDSPEQIDVVCGLSFFSFPKSDCALLPIEFSTAEELSKFFAYQLMDILGEEFAKRKIECLSVKVFERPTQAASYTVTI